MAHGYGVAKPNWWKTFWSHQMTWDYCVFCLNFLLALSFIYSQEHILCSTTFTDEENTVKTQTPFWDPEFSTLVLSPTLLQLEWEWSASSSHFWVLGPQLVALFWKVWKLGRRSPARGSGSGGSRPWGLIALPRLLFLCYPNSETLWPVASGSCPRLSTPWGPVSFQTTNPNRSFLHWVASYLVSQHGMLTLHTLSREQKKTPPGYKSVNDKRHEDDRVRGSKTHPLNYKVTQAQGKFMSLMLQRVLVYSCQELRSVI